MDPQSDTFADRRALHASLLWRTASVTVAVALLAGAAFQPSLGLPPDAPWPLWVSETFLVAAVAAVAFVAARGVLRCRRAPASLAATQGAAVAVVTVGHFTVGANGTLAHLCTAENRSCWLTLLNPPLHPLHKGEVGTLYRAGRAAAGVTNGGTFWAV